MSASELCFLVLGVVLIFIAMFIDDNYIVIKLVLCVIGVFILCCMATHFYKKDLISQCESKLEMRHQKCKIIAVPVPATNDAEVQLNEK